MHLLRVVVEPTETGFRATGRFSRGQEPLEEMYFEASGGAKPPTREMAAAAFLAAALPVSIRLGEDLRSEVPCDEEFAKRAERITHGIARLHGWEQRIRVETPTACSEPAPDRVVASCFSGGIDSFYTLFVNRDPEGPHPVGALLTIIGFDTDVNSPETYRGVVEDAAAVAEEERLRFFPVETNFRSILGPFGDWGTLTHGGLLAATGFILSGSVRTLLVPSSYPIDKLFAWGSHPLIDNSYVSGHTQIVHDAWEVHRNEKLPRMGDWPPVQTRLRVCARRAKGQNRNCGRCEKCIRTKLLLLLNGKLAATTALGAELTPSMIRNLMLKGKNKIAWYQELSWIAKRNPEHKWVADAIAYAIRRSRWRLFWRNGYDSLRGAKEI